MEMKQMSNLLKEAEAARFLRLKPKTLREWRSRGCGPQFYRVGGAIRYDQKHLQQFLITGHLQRRKPKV